MEPEMLATVLAVLMDESDRSGDLRRRVVSRLWALAETEAGSVTPEGRTLLAAVAAGLEGRDQARERGREVDAIW